MVRAYIDIQQSTKIQKEIKNFTDLPLPKILPVNPQKTNQQTSFFAQLCMKYNRDQNLPEIDTDPARFYEYADSAARDYDYYGIESELYRDFINNKLNEFFTVSGYSRTS